MGPEGAVRILYRKQAAKQENPEEFLKEKLIEYRRMFANPYIAANLGYVDDVIDPADTRHKIYKALEILSRKRSEFEFVHLARKHTNIPL